jgi:hypothetical protein
MEILLARMPVERGQDTLASERGHDLSCEGGWCGSGDFDLRPI